MLQSLLQLAKEKLREKEEEIFKLNKEVSELKIYRESVEAYKNPPDNQEQISNESFNVAEIQALPPQFNKSIAQKSSEFSPLKYLSDESSHFKMSPTPSHDGIGDKSSCTPDFFLPSMADSGNFDDLPSSASIYSKDSMSFISSETKSILQDSNTINCFSFKNDLDNDTVDGSEEKKELIQMYEKKLNDKKLEYEMELGNLIKTQEEKNLKMIHEFDEKLKEEEAKFEVRWNDLLKTTEEEKMQIVNRFEMKLEEEKLKYRDNLNTFKAQGGKISDMIFDSDYCKTVEEEKTIYETALVDIKEKFETEKLLIEKKFDEAMATERNKFEDNLQNIKKICDSQVNDLTSKVSELETQ